MKKEEKYFVTRDRISMMNPCYWNGIVQTHPKLKKIYGISPKITWMKFYPTNTDPRVTQFYIKDNLSQTGDFIARKLSKNAGYFGKIINGANAAREEIKMFFKEIEDKDLSKLTFKEYLKLINHIKKIWIEYDLWTVPSWLFAGDVYRDITKEMIGLPEKDFVFLADPEVKTYASQLEDEILKKHLMLKGAKKR